MPDDNNKKPEFNPCDWKSDICDTPPLNISRIIRHRGNFTWNSVKTDKYKKNGDSWSSVIRRALIGNRGESAKFHLRYFEISSGGYSSLEKHRHEHVVICVRGKGRVILNSKKYSVGYLDVVYISPNAIHQLINPYDEPFGFFCIVNAKRDKPKIVSKSKFNTKSKNRGRKASSRLKRRVL